MPAPTKRYFIYDCYGNIAGNPNGYRTFKGANRQAVGRNCNAYRQIWQAYYKSEKENPSIELIYKIMLND